MKGSILFTSILFLQALSVNAEETSTEPQSSPSDTSDTSDSAAVPGDEEQAVASEESAPADSGDDESNAAATETVEGEPTDGAESSPQANQSQRYTTAPYAPSTAPSSEPPPPSLPNRRKSGMGLRISGIVLIALGAANALISLIYIIPPVEDMVDDTYGSGFSRNWMIAWMAIGGTMVSIGIPLLVVGSIQKKRARAMSDTRHCPSLFANVAVDREGNAGFASLRLTF